jgi:anti-sigma factor RsiW
MVSCELVRRELSNFIDGDITPDLRTAIEDHLRQCHPCAVLHGSARNVLSIIRDERVFQVPSGYSQRLHKFLAEAMEK